MDELDIVSDYMTNDSLSISEEMDFHYLLTLMGPLYEVPQYAWLPELFSILGHQKLIMLSKYAGGETITIPKLSEISDAVEAMQWYYDAYIKKTVDKSEIPNKYCDLVNRIQREFNA